MNQSWSVEELFVLASVAASLAVCGSLVRGCDELDESSNAKERVQFLLSHVCKEEFIFYCLKTQKESENLNLYQKPISRGQRLQIILDQLDQMIKV